MSSETLSVTIRRGISADPYDEVFQVPAYENQTVLDVVSWIQQNEDPTLSYRFACRVGMCGSCAMTVNGEPRWTCRTHVKKVVDRGKLEIRPLRSLPIVKDLVTDMDPLFDKWIAAGGKHHASSTRHNDMVAVDPSSDDRRNADLGIECINCGVCHAACDTVANNANYLGPAPLQRAWTLLNDAKDDGRQAIIDAVTGDGGCQNCHSIGACTHYCPVELNPMRAIAGLKREAAKSWWLLRRKKAG